MTDRPTEFGGSPTVLHDARALGGHLVYLVQHGYDPTPHLERFHELIEKEQDAASRDSYRDLEERLREYLRAISSGSVHSNFHKVHVERWPEPMKPTTQNAR